MDLSKILEEFKVQNNSYERYIEQLRDHALEQRENFLSVEPFSLSGEIWAINYMHTYYLNNVFFPDQTLYKKFFDFGIEKPKLRWMMPIEELNEHFDRLLDNGIVVYKYSFFSHLFVYVTIFTTIDVLSWSEIYKSTTRGIQPMTLTKDMELAIDRLNYNASRKYGISKEKDILNSVAKEMAITEKNANLKPKTIISMLNGHIKKDFFIDWLTLSFPYNQNILLQDNFLLQILPLLKYIFRNLEIPENIEDIPDGKYERRKIDKVQLRIIKKWMFKN